MIEAEIVSEAGGWRCRYTPTIMNGPVFRWSPGQDDQFEVSASRDGVVLGGHSLCLSGGAVFRVVEVLDLAARVAELLKGIGSGSVDSIKAEIRKTKFLPATPR